MNFYSILGEGLFNAAGLDLLGITSIAPLFLSQYGASLALIGMLTTVQGIAQAVMPLLAGGATARVKSKRRLSLVGNGISRSLILLIPISLLLPLSDGVIVGVFLFAFVILASVQPVTGLVWNYLLNDCLDTLERPKLFGSIMVLSGIISFGAGNLIKLIRDSSALPENMKYFYIFGLAGLLMSTSVLWFLPLRESGGAAAPGKTYNVKEYVTQLASCFQNKDYRKIASTNVASYVSLVLNAFFYIYAANILKLPSALISNMIIVQTAGQIVGGFVTARVSTRFGVKRLLILSECAGLLVPLLELASMGVKNAYPAMLVGVFLLGFARNGWMGYTNYILEVVEKDKLIFHIVIRGLLLLPISFLSTGAGLYIQNHSIFPVFLLQAAASCAAIFLCTRLRLVSRKPAEVTSKINA